MERKGKKPSSSGDFSEGSVPRTWEERRIVSAPELFEKLNQIPQRRPEAQRELTGSEFLEFLKRQGPEGSRSSRSVNSGQGSAGRQRNQNYQTVAIDQCDITSSVDYGSRDYYCPSSNSADVPYTPKENEMDDLYKNCADTRGNWWQGSFYY